MARPRSKLQGSQASSALRLLLTAFCQALQQSNLFPDWDEAGRAIPMLFVTRWFGVTGSDAERSLIQEQSDIKEIIERVLLMQANAAAQQQRPLLRGTHAKGVCARAQFEVFDVTVGRDAVLARRLAKGIF